jgi:hypothetical protein
MAISRAQRRAAREPRAQAEYGDSAAAVTDFRDVRVAADKLRN